MERAKTARSMGPEVEKTHSGAGGKGVRSSLFPLSVPQLPHLTLAVPTCSSQASFLPPPPSHAPPPPFLACSPTSVEVEEEGAGAKNRSPPSSITQDRFPSAIDNSA